jgi:phosphatidylglycerophosphate synthase
MEAGASAGGDVHRLAVVAGGLTGLAALLAALAAGPGLTPAAWVVGAACGLVPNLAIARGGGRAGRRRSGEAAGEAPTPADLVTLARAVLASGVAALVADSNASGSTGAPSVALVGLTVVALLLDAVDGRVARRTGTVSAFGARFDGETDAFLILVLSVYAVPRYGAWVLAIGLVRYVFWLAGRVLPWLRAPLPARDWRKVVAAFAGVALTVAAAGILPRAVTLGALVVAALFLAESFGRDVLWLWRRRHEVPTAAPQRVVRPAGPGRRVARVLLDVIALLVVWAVLLAPTELPALTPSVLLRIPLELLVVGALALALPTRPRRAVAGVLGVLFALVMIVKLLDMGFFAALDRPFKPVTDLGLFGPVFALVRDTVGRVAGDVVGVAALLVVVGLLVGVPLSVGRISSAVSRHRRQATPVVAGLTALWVVAAAVGWQVDTGEPVAAASSARVAAGQVQLAVTTLRGERRFVAALTRDPHRDLPADRLLTGLSGKDVVVAVVESYGRVAVDGTKGADAGVRDLLRAGTRQLRSAGYQSRSAFLTSPTFGGHSWLAHSTLQSGLWVTDEGRYGQLLGSDRMTLSRFFHRAGWRTVALQPSDGEPWPQGRAFYHYDRIYDGPQLGYRGPRFGFSLMPDQFALEALHRKVLGPARQPVFAQIELASSHTPWAPLPRLVPWDRLGDGAVFGPIHHRAQGIGQLWDHKELVPRAYARSIRYTLTSLIQYVERYGDDDLVLVLLGDHQPASIVSGYHASHQVPITVIASDPTVLRRIDGWHWQRGLLPGSGAPVWPMDAFRDRFVRAYSPTAPGAP